MAGGVVRPYTLLDVLMTINDQVNQTQQLASGGSIVGISVVVEDDEPSMATGDSALNALVTAVPVWGSTVWGSSAWS